jgi:hypothetical protein
MEDLHRASKLDPIERGARSREVAMDGKPIP